MAVRKLPPSLFSAKARAPQSGCSTPYLHFIASFRQEKNQYALVCESQSLATFGGTVSPPVAPHPVQIQSRRTRMVVSKDNNGHPVAWQETYFGANETVNVSVVRNVTTISTRDKTSGKVESKTFLGAPLLPSDVSGGKK